MSEDKEFQQKIKGMFALAPVSQLAHAYKPLKILAEFSYTVEDYVDELHITNPLPLIRNLKDMMNNMIDMKNWIRQVVCQIHPMFCRHTPNITQVVISV